MKNVASIHQVRATTTIFRLQVYERVGISLLEVYETVGKAVISVKIANRCIL